MRMPAFPKRLVIISLLALAVGVLAPQLAAQYYGRNKVQYQKFNFKVMKTRHFDLYFYLEDEQTVKLAGLMAERWYARLSRMFNYEMKTRQPLILYGSSPQFQQTTVISEIMGEGTGGVTESFKRRVVLPYGASLYETDHVIGHELVHAFQYDIMAQGHSDAARASEQSLRIPLWFIEGMAEYLSLGPSDPNTAMWMRDAVRRKDIPALNKLDDSYKYFPYRWGQAVWAYVTGRWGDEIIGKMMKSVGKAGDYEVILEAVLGTKIKQLSADWQKAMRDAYSPLLDKTQATDKVAKVIVKGTEDNAYNISPSVSPDGKQMVFMSSRDLFSIDMYLADAQTGEVRKKLISTALDPHFESIQFIRSAGSWDARGERFVLGGVTHGRPVLTFFDMKKGGKIVREIPFNELGEILSPCWSPDGRYVAFSALAGGVTDIFIYDVENNILKQMTRDAYGDVQPAWSPDGRKIAFVTERFSTNLEWVDIGHYELALMDVESGQIQKVLGFPNGKNIDPHWTADSKGLCFLSDQNGKTDLYRIDLASGNIFELTNLYTGISGITELSPAITMDGSGRILISTYDGKAYSISAVTDPAALEGQTFLAQFDRNPSLLPPRAQAEGSLVGLLKNPLFGLPKDTNFAVSPYKSKLTLDYVTPPTLAIGVDRYGTYGAGGISAFWSDMLGQHTVITTAITGPSLIDTSGAVAYLNSKNRFNWGAALQRIVYPYPYYSYYYDETTYGEPAYVEIEDIYRIINYDLSAFASYPLTSAQRVELTGGFRRIDFNETLYTRVYGMYSGTEIYYSKTHPETRPGLNYGYVTGAMYYDTGIFGATSPIIGQSYGLGVSQSVGNVMFTTVSADFRKYVIPVKPFTLAFRAMHLGRYGRDSEDDRFYPLYLAYWDLVRGYESFNSDNTFDYYRLFGSKIIVANVELRFPLLRLLGIGKGYFGAWPFEVYGFYDAGLAWADHTGGWWGPALYGYTDNDVKAWFLKGGQRKPVTSTGVGIRTNFFGMLVMGLNYVYPIERPERGWHLQFYISPGF